MDEREKLIREIVCKLAKENIKFMLITIKDKGTTRSVNASVDEMLAFLDILLYTIVESIVKINIPSEYAKAIVKDKVAQMLNDIDDSEIK